MLRAKSKPGPAHGLTSIGITELRDINQIANFAVVEWPDNIKISDQAPRDYAPVLNAKMSSSEREDMQRWHALPSVWWDLPYDQFLKERRIKMASLVREGYQKLCGTTPTLQSTEFSVGELLSTGESGIVEFKSTLRPNLHTGQLDDKIQLSVLKTIAGFLNAHGKVLGLAADGFPNEDKMGLHLVNLIRHRNWRYLSALRASAFRGMKTTKRLLVIRCEQGPKSAFVKDGSVQRFYVRGANTTVDRAASPYPSL